MGCNVTLISPFTSLYTEFSKFRFVAMVTTRTGEYKAPIKLGISRITTVFFYHPTEPRAQVSDSSETAITEHTPPPEPVGSSQDTEPFTAEEIGKVVAACGTEQEDGNSQSCLSSQKTQCLLCSGGTRNKKKRGRGDLTMRILLLPAANARLHAQGPDDLHRRKRHRIC
jgi:hypothetical protein